MWTPDKNFPARGFSTPPPHTGKSRRWSPGTPVRPLSEKKVWNSTRAKADLFHVIHKVPSGDSPYVRAKHVQLIEKDPSKAISLFWAAINSGDRVDSALKDMAVAMKQLNRSDEAIEAIKSFRHLCPLESQESLDNVLVELYKRSGRIEEQIEMLQHKVKTIEEGMAFGGKRTKAARSQGKKIQITIDQEYSRLLGNLAWAYLQQNNFKSAEELYRKALSLESDKNKQCNLAICLMHLNRTTEAKILLQSIRPSLIDGQLDESYARSFERATQMLTEIESREAAGLLKKGGSYSENCSNISFADPLKKGSYNENPYERTADFGSKGTGGIEIGSSYKKTYGSPFLPARGIPKVPFTQPRRAFWGDQRRDFPGDDAVGGFNRKLSFEQPFMTHGKFEMSKATLQKSESGSPCFSGDWKKRSWRDLDEVNRESSLQPIEDDVKLTEELQSQCNSVAGNLEHSQDISICKSKKTWADMVEEDEQELLSGINHCQEWNSGEEGFNDENMNSSNIIYHQTFSPFDQIEKLSENIESFDLKDGYHTQPETADSSMNQTVRRSLCFDQQQKTDRTDNYCSSTLPKKVLNFEGYGSFLEKEREFTSGNGIKLLRRNRLKVFRDITLSSESPRP